MLWKVADVMLVTSKYIRVASWDCDLWSLHLIYRAYDTDNILYQFCKLDRLVADRAACLSLGIKLYNRLLANFVLELWSIFLKTDNKKLQEHGRECCHFVIGSLCLWCHNKAGICGTGVCYIMSQHFSAFHWLRANQHGCTQRSSSLKKDNNSNCFCTRNTDRTITGCQQMKIFSHVLCF